MPRRRREHPKYAVAESLREFWAISSDSQKPGWHRRVCKQVPAPTCSRSHAMPSCRASASMAMKPTLCRVSSYRGPGLPSPQIILGRQQGRHVVGSLTGEGAPGGAIRDHSGIWQLHRTEHSLWLQHPCVSRSTHHRSGSSSVGRSMEARPLAAAAASRRWPRPGSGSRDSAWPIPPAAEPLRMTGCVAGAGLERAARLRLRKAGSATGQTALATALMLPCG